VKPAPTQYTQPKNWSLEGNRPRLMHEEAPNATSNNALETGLIVRQPL
jgi:hypothetical protein